MHPILGGPVGRPTRGRTGAAASAPGSPASAQAVVGWGGLLTAVFGPPLVGALLDSTGSFTAGFLSLSAIVVIVLFTTSLIRPFDLSLASVMAEPGVAPT